MISTLVEKTSINGLETKTETKQSYYHKSRPYIKLYIDDVIFDLMMLSASEGAMMLYCFRECDYNNNIYLHKARRQEVAKILDLADGSIKNIISSLKKKNLLISTGNRGEYEVNRRYFYKGRETQNHLTPEEMNSRRAKVSPGQRNHLDIVNSPEADSNKITPNPEEIADFD